MVSVDDILKAISDHKALVLFNTIALTDGGKGTEIQIRKIGLTSMQYYSRLARLRRADLIRRKNGMYVLTLLGKIVYEVHMIICKVLSYHWKLKAIESIQMSASATTKYQRNTSQK